MTDSLKKERVPDSWCIITEGLRKMIVRFVDCWTVMSNVSYFDSWLTAQVITVSFSQNLTGSAFSCEDSAGYTHISF